MSKRVANRKGSPTSNRCGRNTRYNNYMERLADTKSAFLTVDDAKKALKNVYKGVQDTASKFVPKGASKLLSSIVRQRG